MVWLVRFWLGLCLLRTAPQDGPASAFMLGITLACYVSVSLLVLAGSYGIQTGVALAFAELVLLAVFVALLLYLTGKLARFNQTLSAMTGAGTLLGLLALPLALLAEPSAVNGGQPLALAWLILLLWNLIVSAHIMRHALSTNLVVGFAVSLVYMLLTTQLVLLLFPQLAETMPAG